MYFCQRVIHLKKMYPGKYILSILFSGLLFFSVQAQCPDFMDLSSSAVTGYYGVYNSLLDDTIQWTFGH